MDSLPNPVEWRRETGQTRLLMRRDQTRKVCANHPIGPDLQLRPMAASDRAWTYATVDLAEEEVTPIACVGKRERAH